MSGQSRSHAYRFQGNCIPHAEQSFLRPEERHMNQTSLRTAAIGWPRWFGAFGLAWNLYGVYQYLTTVGLVGPTDGAQPTAADAMPLWVTAAFAIGVFAGTLGSLCLLLLNRWATLLLVLSLIADLLWDVRMLSGGDRGSAAAIVIASTVVAIILAWTSYHAGKKGWLR